MKRITAFISYSYDSDEHKQWVLRLAQNLRRDGINVILDQWSLRLGNDMFSFMESSIQQSQFVLIIGTENYAKKANMRSGGVGYEATIITPEIVLSTSQGKFIPILKSGDFSSSMPLFLKSRYAIDLGTYPDSTSQYEELVKHIYNNKAKLPPIGKKPQYLKSVNEKQTEIGNISLESVSIKPKNKQKTNQFELNQSMTNPEFDAELSKELFNYPMSKLLYTFSAKRNEIEIRVIQVGALKPSPEEIKEFDVLNGMRKDQNMHMQYPAKRYRLLKTSWLANGKIIFDVAPFNFITFAILRDSQNQKLKDHLQSKVKFINSKIKNVKFTQVVPIGVEILLVTRDSKILLRKRSATVQTEKSKWDVSISGYVELVTLSPDLYLKLI